MQVLFYPQAKDCLYKFSVIVARYKNKWIFCKQKNKNTWEFPGGTREEGESILDCAKRELQEESGAISFTIKEIWLFINKEIHILSVVLMKKNTKERAKMLLNMEK